MATGSKTGGRDKGTPNKVTKEIKEAFQTLVEGNIDNLDNWINETAKKDPAKAIDIILKISEYVLPKLSRTELKTNFDKLTDEQLDYMINKLKYQNYE